MENLSKLNHNIKNHIFMNMHAHGSMRITRMHESKKINHEEQIPHAIYGRN